MSLISIQRSPSPVEELGVADDSALSPTNDVDENDDQRTSSSGQKSRSLSECYFTVRGAAVILAHTDQASTSSIDASNTQQNDIQTHLRAMLNIIRPEDSLTMTVRLQSGASAEQHIRYLAVLSTTMDATESHEAAILGFDFLTGEPKSSIGVAVPISAASDFRLDGDGGIKLEDTSHCCKYLFKPASIQSMWSLYQCLHREREVVAEHCKASHFSGHRWLDYYKGHIAGDDALCGQWHFVEEEGCFEGELKARASTFVELNRSGEELEMEARIRGALKQIMQSVDLDDVTSQDIRRRLGEQVTLVGVELGAYKAYIDSQMLVILGQLDKPSEIFDYLYLGTEWNASNWEELKAKGVEYILNMTKEVDNFFPTQFKYMKIWVSDEASTELLMHWQRTYDFIKEAKERGSKVLVHCKKGISRSASTVVAYAMKEYQWSLDEALDHVKRKRDCITPNHGFMQQLETFRGMLQASKNRHSAVFNLTRGESQRLSVRSVGGAVPASDATSSGSELASVHSQSPALTPPSDGKAGYAKNPRKNSIQLMGHLFHTEKRRRPSLSDHNSHHRLCWSNGKVRQRRESFEQLKQNNKSTKQLVSSIAKKIGHLSLYGRLVEKKKDGGTEALVFNKSRNWMVRQHMSSPRALDRTGNSNVKSLVIAFEQKK